MFGIEVSFVIPAACFAIVIWDLQALRMSVSRLGLVRHGGLWLLLGPVLSAFVAESGDIQMDRKLLAFVLPFAVAKTVMAICRMLRARLDVVGIAWIVLLPLSALVAALGSDSSGLVYHYRDAERLNGMFAEPNTFGASMAIGLIALAASVRIALLRTHDYTTGCRVIKIMAGAMAIWLTGLLMRSFSRTAWVIASVGTWLTWRAGNCATSAAAVAVPRTTMILGAGAIVAAVGAGHVASTSLWAQRALSALDRQDLSWLHRVYAAEAGWRAILEAPWCGYGRDCALDLTTQLYASPAIATSAAIATNDYVTVGAWLGIAGLLGLTVYTTTSLCACGCLPPNQFAGGTEVPTNPYSLYYTAAGGKKGAMIAFERVMIANSLRAIVLVLAIAASVNSVFFEPYLALVFWISLELFCYCGDISRPVRVSRSSSD